MHVAIFLIKYLIKHARGVIAVSQGVAEDFKEYFPLSVNRVHVVYNPSITTETRQRAKELLVNCSVPKSTPFILYAGRFVYAKGLDVLIKAFRLIKYCTKANLILMGEGPLKTTIAAEAKAANLESRIKLIGFQADPLPWIYQADALVLPSRHEGLPNVLIEALMCGTQIVATDCPSGPAEILENGQYGQLVPVEDPEALGAALLESLSQNFYVPPAKLQERAAYFSSKHAASRYVSILNGMNDFSEYKPRMVDDVWKAKIP